MAGAQRAESYIGRLEFVAFIVFSLYLVPWIIAAARNHEHHYAILALVLLLGWTGVGWIAGLAWALAQPDPKETRASRNFELRVIDGEHADETPSSTARTERSNSTISVSKSTPTASP